MVLGVSLLSSSWSSSIHFDTTCHVSPNNFLARQVSQNHTSRVRDEEIGEEEIDSSA